MEDCPICYEEISGAVTKMGCCQKNMHAECYIKCMARKTECPMCRADQNFEMPEIEGEEEEEEPVTTTAILHFNQRSDNKKIFIPIILLSMSLGTFFSVNPSTFIPSSVGILLGSLVFR